MVELLTLMVRSRDKPNGALCPHLGSTWALSPLWLLDLQQVTKLHLIWIMG